jgi:hypothetical protein
VRWGLFGLIACAIAILRALVILNERKISTSNA